MNITVIGAGYVGLVTAVCFANLGNHVFCIDINEKKITNLQKNVIPFYEPLLEKLVKRNIRSGKLEFTSEYEEVIKSAEICFIAVGTPSTTDGSAELKYVFEAADKIGQFINGKMIIVDKSTVPVGTSKQVNDIIEQKINERYLEQNIEFEVLSNPEFLREGNAVKGFF